MTAKIPLTLYTGNCYQKIQQIADEKFIKSKKLKRKFHFLRNTFTQYQYFFLTQMRIESCLSNFSTKSLLAGYILTQYLKF